MLQKKSIFAIFLLAFATIQCTTSKKTAILGEKASVSSLELVSGLLQPVTLEPQNTTILLSDYFNNISKVERIELTDNAKFVWHKGENEVKIEVGGQVPALIPIKFYTEIGEFALILKRSLKQKVTLTFEPKGKNYKKIQVAGDINNWQPNGSEFAFDGKKWTRDFLLNPGAYSYKMVVDSTWMLDPANAEQKDNGFGGSNSLLTVSFPKAENLPILVSQGMEGNELKGVCVSPSSEARIIALLDNKEVAVTVNRSLINPIFRVAIPEFAKKTKRSTLRIYAQNAAGAANDLFIPLEYGVPVQNAAQLTRADKQAQTMYFTLVDRFVDGNKTNNKPLIDKRLTERENFQGGDIAGITQKINSGYFDQLSIGTLWVSPISQQPLDAWQEFPAPRRWYSGYHGYWPVSSSKIDFRFGTDAEMKALVAAAHKHNINVILDYVAHHVHQLHPLYIAHPDQVTPFTLPDGRKNLRIWDEQRLTTWFDDFLPTLNLNNDEVANIQVDSAMYWINKFDLDGFRHDATKHIPTSFWRKLTTKMKESGRGTNYQIGETFGSRELIQSYIGNGMLDAQFDFNLYFDAREVFGKDGVPFSRLQNSLTETFSYFGNHSTMGNITGNHDLVRFMGLASNAVKWDEDGKEAGYARKIEVKDAIGYNRLQMLTAFLMTVPGVPILFYGDEIGMVGAGDPDNRRMMRFDNLNKSETQTKAIATQLSLLRKTHLEMTYGDFIPLANTADTWSYSRTYMGKTSVIVFNKGTKPTNISIKLPEYLGQTPNKPQFGNTISVENNSIKLTLPAYSFEVITYEK